MLWQKTNNQERLASKEPLISEANFIDEVRQALNPHQAPSAIRQGLLDIINQPLPQDRSERNALVADLLNQSRANIAESIAAGRSNVDKQTHLLANVIAMRVAKSGDQAIMDLISTAKRASRLSDSAAKTLANDVLSVATAIQQANSLPESSVSKAPSSLESVANFIKSHHRSSVAVALGTATIATTAMAPGAQAATPSIVHQIETDPTSPTFIGDAINLTGLFANPTPQEAPHEPSIDLSGALAPNAESDSGIDYLAPQPTDPNQDSSEQTPGTEDPSPAIDLTKTIDPSEQPVPLEKIDPPVNLDDSESDNENDNQKIEGWDPEAMSNGLDILKSLQEKYDESGHLNASELETIDTERWGRHQLIPEAATAMRALSDAFKAEFGEDIQFTDSYRPYDVQVACYNDPDKITEDGVHMCATPGSSVHGWGMAVDFASHINEYNSEQFNWMRQNAGQFGFVHPEWARQYDEDGTKNKPEAWHWEYIGQPAIDVSYSVQIEKHKEHQKDQEAERNSQPEASSEILTGRELDIAAAAEMRELGGRMGRAGRITEILLRETDLTPGQICGILGNLDVESAGLIPSRKQFGGGPGRGLAQWGSWEKDSNGNLYSGGRFTKLKEFAHARGTSWKDLETQVLFLVHELETYDYLGYDEIKQSDVVSEASYAFLTKFERPQEIDNTERAKRGNEFYAQFDEIRQDIAASQAAAQETRDDDRSSEDDSQEPDNNNQESTRELSPAELRVEVMRHNQSWDDMVYPVAAKNASITSGVGYRAGNNYHRGVDLAIPVGTDFIAPFAGIVYVDTRDTNTPGCNNLLRSFGFNPANRDPIQKNVYLVSQINGKMVTFYYGHLSEFGEYEDGDVVQPGAVLGQSGSSGCSTGPHAHIEASSTPMPGNNMTPSNVDEVVIQHINVIEPGVHGDDVVTSLPEKIAASRGNKPHNLDLRTETRVRTRARNETGQENQSAPAPEPSSRPEQEQEPPEASSSEDRTDNEPPTDQPQSTNENTSADSDNESVDADNQPEASSSQTTAPQNEDDTIDLSEPAGDGQESASSNSEDHLSWLASTDETPEQPTDDSNTAAEAPTNQADSAQETETSVSSQSSSDPTTSNETGLADQAGPWGFLSDDNIQAAVDAQLRENDENQQSADAAVDLVLQGLNN